MKKPGRKSAASLAVVQTPSTRSRQAPPSELDPNAARLWREIIASYPLDHFNAADLVLLREFCVTSETLLPAANSEAESGGGMQAHSLRNMHVKSIALLASRLRLNVSARTRPDTAKMRDAGTPRARIDWSKANDD